MEDFDIYADLPSFNINDQENEDQKNKCKKFEEKNQILEKEVGLLRTKVEKLEALNNKLQNNFSSLIKTAKAEISRKDRTIKDLRAQLDDLAFRRHKNYRHKTQQSNHYPHCPPPAFNTVFNDEVNQYQQVYETQSVSEEFLSEENIEVQQKINENECNDIIPNNPGYQNTIYGDRLRKRLLKEKEEEKRKREEELNQSKECLDKVNNKENLALINEVTKNIDNNINSDKPLDTGSNSADFVKAETTLTNKIDCLESTKKTQNVNSQYEIPKTNKYIDTISGVNDSDSKKSSNTGNGSTIQKNNKNQDHFNHDRHKHSEIVNTKENNQYIKRDRHKHLFEKYYRHRSSHRYKSRDRERSSSSSGTKDDYRKKHYKSVENKYNCSLDKIFHKKDREDKHAYKRRKENRKREHNNENSRKQNKDKIKSPKRKRQSSSEESVSYKTKRSKTSIENSNKITNSNRISVTQESKNDFQSNETMKEEKRKLKFDTEKSKNYVEQINETSKLNKTTVEETSIKRKETFQEKDRKKITIQECNEKISNNIECVKDSGKSNINAVNEIKTYNFNKKNIIQRQEINQNKNHEKVISNAKNVKNVQEINKESNDNVKCSMEELEEGEIADSPDHNMQTDSDDKIETAINADVCKETTILKEFKIQKNDKIKKNLSNCKIENNDLSKSSNENCKSMETKTMVEEHYVQSTKPKKDENKNVKHDSVLNLHIKNVSEKPHSSYKHKGIQEGKDVEKTKLKEKSVEPESNIEKSNKISDINIKLTKLGNDKINNKVPELCTEPVEQDWKHDKLRINDDEICKETNIETYFNEQSVDSVSDSEEYKDNDKLQIIEDEIEDFETDQNSTDTVLNKSKKNESNSDDNLNKQVLKSLNLTETENSLNKTIPSAPKSQSVKNVIMIKRRRKPVQLSDSPPVLIISQTEAYKST